MDARAVKTAIYILCRGKVKFEDLFRSLDEPARPHDRMTPEQLTAAFTRWHASSQGKAAQ